MSACSFGSSSFSGILIRRSLSTFSSKKPARSAIDGNKPSSSIPLENPRCAARTLAQVAASKFCGGSARSSIARVSVHGRVPRRSSSRS
jgi:hypothetical protein